MKKLLLSFLSLILITACGPEEPLTLEDIVPTDPDLKVATFSGGCFWCTESDFEKHEGVIEAISGFTGGEEESPSYKEVASGQTGHREGVQVYYDPEVITYEKLLDVFWKHINPTDDGGQFVDRGSQYSSAIYYHSEEERQLANASKQALADSERYEEEIVTPILPFSSFYPAEMYHQDYYKKNPLRYKYYRNGSGRDQYIESIWGSEEEQVDERLAHLTPLQFDVTQNDATEPPFDNAYWDNNEAGIYVDIVSGEALFSSTHKFVSGTGWPSFTEPLAPENIVEQTDYILFYPRTELRSKEADSHLGHVFSDGPEPTGLRYCINSASLRFVPADQLESEGYEEYLSLFES